LSKNKPRVLIKLFLQKSVYFSLRFLIEVSWAKNVSLKGVYCKIAFTHIDFDIQERIWNSSWCEIFSTWWSQVCASDIGKEPK